MDRLTGQARHANAPSRQRLNDAQRDLDRIVLTPELAEVEVDEVFGPMHRAKNFVYLNFGEFWRQDYSVQIPLSVVETLAGRGVSVSSLAGQAVQVRGRLGRYNGPSLRVERAEDFEVLGLRKGSSPWP